MSEIFFICSCFLYFCSVLYTLAYLYIICPCVTYFSTTQISMPPGGSRTHNPSRLVATDRATTGILQGGSNMTGTNSDLFTHKSSRSYLNHLVFICQCSVTKTQFLSKLSRSVLDSCVSCWAAQSWWRKCRTPGRNHETQGRWQGIECKQENSRFNNKGARKNSTWSWYRHTKWNNVF